uniref:Uncharacterized protein n=1 Tax=Panagrellus redivivus TaxID=6233 RepID=A0A7E4VWZ0_PANRE
MSFGGGHIGYQNGYGNYGGDSYSGFNRGNWCPSGLGYPTYCPTSGYGYEYTNCCSTFLWFGSGCCYNAISAWNIIIICLAIFLLLAATIYLSCRYCTGCPLYNRQRALARGQVRNPRQQQYYPGQPQPGYSPAPPGVVYYDKEPGRH